MPFLLGGAIAAGLGIASLLTDEASPEESNLPEPPLPVK